MITIINRRIYAADDLEVLIVTMRDGTTYLAGGMLFDLVCDPRLLQRTADLTHGVVWCEGDNAYLYAMDFAALGFLADPRSIVRRMGICVGPEGYSLKWDIDLSDYDLHLFSTDKLWQASDWAKPPPARELRLHVKDYGELSIWGKDGCLVRLPDSQGICNIQPEPETLNGCHLHEWATVAGALRAANDSGFAGSDRKNVFSIFFADEDWPPSIAVIFYAGCGHRFFAIYYSQYATMVSEDLAQGCGHKAQSNPMPGACPACEKA